MRFRGTPFADLADGAHVLVEALRTESSIDNTWVVVAVLPGGAPVGRIVADEFGCKIVALKIGKTEDISNARVELMGAEAAQLAGRNVVIVDDGVESGTAARAAISFIRGLQVSSLVLAVPICHAHAAADLGGGVDQLVAPRRPFTPRALRWEYKSFAPPTDDASALEMVEPLGL